MGSFLRLDHVNFNYHGLEGETLALANVSFEIEEGEFAAIVGPSGCGKTTLLSLIAGLEQPDMGSITIQDSKAPVGYMLQKDQLLEWRTTWHNVLLGPEIRGGIRPEHRQRAEELLKLYGLYEFRNSYPSELSGGMRQRAALIRTLMTEPELLLLDEPFSALDYQTRLRVSDDIWNIIKEQKKTAILITHDISEAVSMADRVLVLSGRPGTILRDIPICFASLSERTPFAARSAVEFKDYFQQIWKEMNRNEETE
ncbi:MAG: ABC transporter ATP-binding protein [Lachnospiraceae bacterium]|nr:ABC transporter ATP-binding protein [Lachnospiraceae bacterium]